MSARRSAPPSKLQQFIYLVQKFFTRPSSAANGSRSIRKPIFSRSSKKDMPILGKKELSALIKQRNSVFSSVEEITSIEVALIRSY